MKDKRLYHSVAEQIKALIKEGTYPPGSRLPGEREIAERFEVSRVTVREAEIALQALGYVHIKTGSGVYVLDRNAAEGAAFPEVSPFELTEARLLFESEAAALAAKQIDDATLDRLEALVDAMSSEDPDSDEAAQKADREFHLTIASASGNAAVRHTVENLWKMRQELPEVHEVHNAICAIETARDRCAEHREVLVALRNHDAAGARLAMQKHFRHLLKSMIDVTEEKALEELRRQSSESRQRYLDAATSGQSA